MRYINDHKPEYVIDSMPIDVLFVEDVFESFFEQGLKERFKDVQTRIGFPKADFKAPSIYISLLTVQMNHFIGGQMAKYNSDAKLDIKFVYDDNNVAIGYTTDIANRDAPLATKGMNCVASLKISCYAERRTDVVRLAEAATSLILYNFPGYLSSFSELKEKEERFDPHFADIRVNTLTPNFHEELSQVKNVYSATLGVSASYFTRISQKHTWLTGFSIEQTAKSPVTEEVVQISKLDIDPLN